MHSTNLVKSVLKSQEFTLGENTNTYSNYKRNSNQSIQKKYPVSSNASIDGQLANHRSPPSSGIAGSPSIPNKITSPVKRACLCAPTNHPGSFRCKFHRSKSVSRQSAVSSAIENLATDLAKDLSSNLGTSLTTKLPFTPTAIVARRSVLGVRSPSAFPPPSPLSSSNRARVLGSSRLSRMTSASADNHGYAEKADENPLRFLKQAISSGASSLKKGVSGDGSSTAAIAQRGGDQFYEVKPKDNLSQIAKSFGTEVDVLMEANALTTDVIKAGQKIWIPHTYTIQKGDTLTKIAKEQGTSVGEILSMNRIENPDQILPGDILLLP